MTGFGSLALSQTYVILPAYFSDHLLYLVRIGMHKCKR